MFEIKPKNIVIRILFENYTLFLHIFRLSLPLDSKLSIHRLGCDLLCESKSPRRCMHPVNRFYADIDRCLPTYSLYDRPRQDRAAVHVCVRSPKRRGLCPNPWFFGNPMSDFGTADLDQFYNIGHMLSK